MTLSFYCLEIIILFSALKVVTNRNIFHCGLYLAVCLFGIAGLYVLLNAELLAAVQVLIYVGGVVVLILFAVMLTKNVTGHGILQANEQARAVFLASALLLFLMLKAWKQAKPLLPEFPPSETTVLSQTPSAIGQQFITTYVLPFEVASAVLLVAMLGAIIFLKRGE